MRVGGVIVCGGSSVRMGRPKEWLPFGKETMLQRVARTLKAVVSPVVVVAAAGQELPALPAEIEVVHDRVPERGPLEGISVGLTSLPVDAAYVTSCDVPFLIPAFVRFMIDSLSDDDIAVPVDQRFHHPLAAVYRVRTAAIADRLLDADRRRPVFLFDEARTRRVPVAELRSVDPELLSLWNINHQQDYVAALERAEAESNQ